MTGKELSKHLEKLRLNHTDKKSEQIIEVSANGGQIRFASVDISSETPKILYHTTNNIKHDTKESCFCEIGVLIKMVNKASSPSFIVSSDKVVVKDVLKVVGEIKSSGYQLHNSRSYDFFEYMRSVSGCFMRFDFYCEFFKEYVQNKENNTIIYAEKSTEIICKNNDSVFEHFVVRYTKDKETGYTKLKDVLNRSLDEYTKQGDKKDKTLYSIIEEKDIYKDLDFTLLNTTIETAQKFIEGKINLINFSKDNSIYGSFSTDKLIEPLLLSSKYPTFDDLKPNLQYAVLFNECGRSICYASDSHALIRYTMDVEVSEAMCEIHPKIGFHSTTIDILTKVLKDTHTCNIYGSKEYLLYAVVSEGFVVVLRQFEGRYVDYRSVIPNSYKVSFNMKTSDLSLIGSMNTDSDVDLVKFVLNEKYIQSISENIDYGSYTRVKTFISNYVNETGLREFGLNYNKIALFADTLSKARVEEFTMFFNYNDHPVYIEANNILLLVIPMLIE